MRLESTVILSARALTRERARVWYTHVHIQQNTHRQITDTHTHAHNIGALEQSSEINSKSDEPNVYDDAHMRTHTHAHACAHTHSHTDTHTHTHTEPPCVEFSTCPDF